MNKKRKFNFRYVIIYGLFLAACIVFVIKLVNIQITGADYYSYTGAATHSREVAIQSLRGEIFDRNGKALVKNAYTETLQFDYEALPRTNSARNSAIAKAAEVLWDNGVEIKTQMPITGTYPNIAYDDDALSRSSVKNKLAVFLLRYNLVADITCIDLYEELLTAFDLIAADGSHLYEGRYEDIIIRIRYDLEVTNFAADNPYTLAKDMSLPLITAVLENNCRGVNIVKEFSRTYCYPGVGSNILGRIGKIPAEKLDEYLQLGYAYNAVIGLDGVEAAFEDVLAGRDGVMVIEEDDYGNIINSYVKEKPTPGRNIYLTIDIGLQEAAEKALEKTIKELVAKAVASGVENSGEKADSGALTVISPSTGQVLALASYPTYDLSTFSDDYSKLVSNPAKPLFDRSLFGSYQPGSTFKIATSVAALSVGTITTSTTYFDTGKYTYYDDYQPSCWLKYGHGKVNVVSAIGHSCNCFFYDVGRLTGIQTLNKYCTSFGLGQHTGIELPESKGVLAGLDNAALTGTVWNPGDTLQAAIGQSVNSFTPLQLSSYISTVINGGTRYKATVLQKTSTYSGADAVVNKPLVYNTVEISDTTLQAVRQGMKNAKEWTSATKGYKFAVGTKTGTAQTDETNNNAVFVAFAPYENPEIVLSCVIENGANGGNAVPAVFSTISYYFNLNADGSEKTED